MQISDHQQSWGYADGTWKGPRPPLLVVADFLILDNLKSGKYPIKIQVRVFMSKTSISNETVSRYKKSCDIHWMPVF
jgi:hypothetical protein